MFIRTEYGVYELSDNYIIKNNKLYEKEYFINPFGDGTEEYLGETLIGEILKQSDNLDELIDGYYVQIDDWNFDKTHLFDNLEDAIMDFEDWKSYSDRKYLSYEIFIYGFIKTDKGLIYVAKKNGEGKLCRI